MTTLAVLAAFRLRNSGDLPGSPVPSTGGGTTAASGHSSSLPPVQPNGTAGTAVAPVAPPAAVWASDPPSEAPIPDRAIIASRWTKSKVPQIGEFARWAQRYAAAPASDRPALAATGLDLARARRPVMLGLIEHDPREALAMALPVAIVKELPTAVRDQIEQRVSGEGDLYRVAGLPPQDVTTPVRTLDYAQVNGQYYEAHRYGTRAAAAYLKDASLHGVALDRQLAVSASPIRETEPGEAAVPPGAQCVVAGVTVTAPEPEEPPLKGYQIGNQTGTTCCPFCTTHFPGLEQKLLAAEQNGTPLSVASAGGIMGLGDGGVAGTADYPGKPPTAWTNGGKKVIYLRVDFSDTAYPAAFTTDYLATQTFGTTSLNTRTQRNSYGQAWISDAAYTPVMRMPKTSWLYWHDTSASDAPVNMNNYWGPILDDAKAAATALGYNVADYACYIVVHANFVQTGAAGWGGGGAIWCNGYADWHLLTHEYGHVFWLPHANSWTSTDGDPMSATRAHVEYGDAADPMGNAWNTSLNNEYNVYFKSFCNWLPDASVQTVTHSGTYRLYQNDGAANTSANPVRALKISRDGALDYWLGYRGSSISQNLFNQGVSVLAVTTNTASDTHLVDMNVPSGDTANAPLAQGQSWHDTVGGVTLKNVGRGGFGDSQYIYVNVAFDPNYIQGQRPLVSGGIYRLLNKYYNKYLDVPNNTNVAGTQLRLWTGNTSDAQKWVAVRNADGSYSFQHYNSSLWMDVAGNSANNYAAITIWTKNGVDGQRFETFPTADGYWMFRHRTTTQVVCADTANNGAMIQYPNYNLNEQKWTVELVGLTEGAYRLTPRHAQSEVVGVPDGASASGTPVRTAVYNGAKSQIWGVKPNANGTFRLIPQHAPTKSLGLAGGAAAAAGAAAVIADNAGTTDQQWNFGLVSGNWVRLFPANNAATALSVTGASTAPGTGLQISANLNTADQAFEFQDSDL